MWNWGLGIGLGGEGKGGEGKSETRRRGIGGFRCFSWRKRIERGDRGTVHVKFSGFVSRLTVLWWKVVAMLHQCPHHVESVS
jgi:hypothetical protein